MDDRMKLEENFHHGARELFPPSPLPGVPRLRCTPPRSVGRPACRPPWLPSHPFPCFLRPTGSIHPQLSAPSLVHSLATIPQPRLDSLLLLRFPMLCFCLSFFLFCFSLRFAFCFSLFARLARFCVYSRSGISNLTCIICPFLYPLDIGLVFQALRMYCMSFGPSGLK